MSAGAGDAAAVPEILEQLAARLDGESHALVRALLDAVLALHREALVRTLAVVGDDRAAALAQDPCVASVLALHGLHPEPVAARVAAALAALEAELRALGAAVSVRAVTDDEVTLALEAGSAAVRPRVRALCEAALYDAAPEIDEVHWASAADASAPPAGFVPAARLARARPATDRCALCDAEISAVHPHYFDPARAELHCACARCVDVTLGGPRAAWRRVRRHLEKLDGFTLEEHVWRALGVPVDVAFITCRASDGRAVARYPGAAGAVEAEVPAGAWRALVADHARLAALEPDLEALLVNRLDGAREYYVASVDVCFELAGVLRRAWRGFTGGPDARAALAAHLGALRDGADGPSCSS